MGSSDFSGNGAAPLQFFKVPKPEKGEVLTAFAAHKDEVTAGTSRPPNAAKASCSPVQTMPPSFG
jgi:hypothetical protein